MNIFVTFGAGEEKYIEAGNRLVEQAKQTGYFDKIIFYTEKDLINDKFFWDQHSEFISKNKKGYGYWIWKPYVIKKTMETMKNGDILMYLDCGCEIGGSKQLSIPKFFDYVKKDKIITTICKRWICFDKEWCKMDVLLHFDMQNSELINTRQYQAGAVMYYVCDKIKSFIDLWYETVCDYHMIDDSPSIKPNFKSFREHRHDQSIFSLLLKKYNIQSDKSIHHCVYIRRNRSGSSKIDEYT